MNEMTRILVPENFKARFTTAEFERMCDSDVFEDWDIELVDGELERMPPPQLPHAFLQGTIYSQLLALFGTARVLVEIGIDLGSNTVFGVDVAVLHTPATGRRWLRPDEVMLAVEVSETTFTRDVGMKAVRYGTAGIPHYWVVDGATSVIHVFGDPKDGQYAPAQLVRFGEPLAVPGTDATITLS